MMLRSILPAYLHVSLWTINLQYECPAGPQFIALFMAFLLTLIYDFKLDWLLGPQKTDLWVFLIIYHVCAHFMLELSSLWSRRHLEKAGLSQETAHQEVLSEIKGMSRGLFVFHHLTPWLNSYLFLLINLEEEIHVFTHSHCHPDFLWHTDNHETVIMFSIFSSNVTKCRCQNSSYVFRYITRSCLSYTLIHQLWPH